jgi:hypothetical protein
MLDRRWIGIGIVCAGLGLGCSSDPLAWEDTGTVAIKLVTEGPNASRYRLNGKFEIAGDGREIVLEASSSDSVLRQTLEAGAYTVRLLDDWYIEQQNLVGWEPVETVLANRNPQPLMIANGTETESEWQFYLRAPDGQALIRFDVSAATTLLGFVFPDAADGSMGMNGYDFGNYFTCIPGETSERVTNTRVVRSRTYSYALTTVEWAGEPHPLLSGLGGEFTISANFARKSESILSLSSVTWSGFSLVGTGSVPAPPYTNFETLTEEGWSFAGSEVFAAQPFNDAVTTELEEFRDAGPPALTAEGFPVERIEFSTLTRSNRYFVDGTDHRVESAGTAFFNLRLAIDPSEP